MNRYQMDITEKVLSNGMRVILVHKPDYNRSLFMLSTQAGGFDIKQRVKGEIVTHPSGCAHFLEHQMFRLNQVDVTDEFASMGAQTNAFTSYTKTAYYFQTTSDVLRPLQLLMDFVQQLDIDYESVEKEKGIILSEYDMYQQSVEHRVLHDTFESMYLYHPLKTDILGSRLDISSMSVEQLQTFYDYNYDSSRLTLVGITGKEIDPIMEQIEQVQQKYPSKHPENVRTYFDEEVTKIVRENYLDKMDISTPYVCVGYKCFPVPDPDTCLKTDIAVQMRLDSLFSPMNEQYQQWMDQRILTPVMSAECDFTQDHGYMLFFAQTSKPEEFVQLVDSLVRQMREEEMKPEVFEALQKRLVAQNIRSLDHFENTAADLLDASQRGYSFRRPFELAESLHSMDILGICKSLMVDQRTVSTIQPKSS